jgi:hypothetical protein
MGTNGESDALWTPTGIVRTDGKKLTRIELRPKLMEYMVQFSMFAQSQRIGWHCADCGADIVGKNSPTDSAFAVACNCREWVGGNRDYQPVKQQ